MFSNFSTYADSILLYFLCMIACFAFAAAAQVLPRERSLVTNEERSVQRSPSLVLMILCGMVMVLLCYYRENVGVDYESYCLIFDKAIGKNVPHYKLPNFDEIELGFVWLNQLVGALGGDLHMIMGLSAALMMAGVIMVWYDYAPKMSIALSALVFYSTFFFISMNITRQFIIVGFALYATKYIYERKPIPFLIWLFVCSLFHGSVWILLLFYPAESKNEHFAKIYRRALLVGLMAFTVLLPILGTRLYSIPVFGNYLQSQGDLSGISLRTMFKIATIILRLPAALPCLLFAKELIRHDPRNRMHISFVAVELIMGFWGNIGGIFLRPGIYLQMSWILLLPQLVRLQDSRGKQYLVGAYVVLFCLGSWLYNFVIQNFGLVLPYQTF